MKSAVNSNENTEWKRRLNLDQSLHRFKLLHPTIDTAMPWHFMKSYPEIRNETRLCAKLWTCCPGRQTVRCVWCTIESIDIVHHLILECTHAQIKQVNDQFWTDVVNVFDVGVYVFLDNIDTESLISILLGGPFGEFINLLNGSEVTFQKTVYKF